MQENNKPSPTLFSPLKWCLVAMVLSMLPLSVQAVDVASRIRPDHPESYVVVKGDTLWDISKRFLSDPWLWPEIWYVNPEIRNPHLIYPGDKLVFTMRDGKPYVTLAGTDTGPRAIPPQPKTPMSVAKPGLKVETLSPRMREIPLDKAITALPMSEIKAFLARPRYVVDEGMLDDAPYIVSSYEGHLISGTGNRIYATGITDPTQSTYNVVHLGDKYRDPITDRILGYEVDVEAIARVIKLSKPATLEISEGYREVVNGDKLLPLESSVVDFTFFPRAPSKTVEGYIIDVYNGVAEIGQYNVVTLNIGKRDGIEPGHVLAIEQRGESVRNRAYGEIELPAERVGTLMVFHSYDRVSYALVMDAERPIHVKDMVTNP